MIALPVSVSHSVDEVHPSEFVHGEQVSRPEPHVSPAKDVLADLLLGGGLVDVAVEASGRVAFDDLPHELARLVGLADDGAARVGVSNHVSGLVHSNQPDGIDKREQDGSETH